MFQQPGCDHKECIKTNYTLQFQQYLHLITYAIDTIDDKTFKLLS